MPRRERARPSGANAAGVASSRAPAAAIAMRGLVSVASTPHRAVTDAMAALLVMDQAARERATRSSGSRSRRYVWYTGVYRPMKTISPVWAATKNARPPGPLKVNARTSGKHARAQPATSSSRWRPNRAASRAASREAMNPPTHGRPQARPYIQGVNFSWLSSKMANSGSVARISAPVSTLLASSRRSTGSASR